MMLPEMVRSWLRSADRCHLHLLVLLSYWLVLIWCCCQLVKHGILTQRGDVAMRPRTCMRYAPIPDRLTAHDSINTSVLWDFQIWVIGDPHRHPHRSPAVMHPCIHAYNQLAQAALILLMDTWIPRCFTCTQLRVRPAGSCWPADRVCT